MSFGFKFPCEAVFRVFLCINCFCWPVSKFLCHCALSRCCTLNLMLKFAFQISWSEVKPAMKTAAETQADRKTYTKSKTKAKKKKKAKKSKKPTISATSGLPEEFVFKFGFVLLAVCVMQLQTSRLCSG